MAGEDFARGRSPGQALSLSSTRPQVEARYAGSRSCAEGGVRSNHPLRDPPGRVLRLVRRQDELEEPILAELFSAERLEQHAQTLAAAQTVTDAPHRGNAVLPRIAEN